MSYKYQYANGKLQRNRLYHINDAVSASVDNTDIDDQGTFDPLSTNINQNNNYKYDEEGRLVRDIAEDIAKITWRVDGKVKEIQRGADTSTRFIRFDYDAMGHRIAKHVYDNTGTILKKSTYYILDAQGNQIAMYEHLTAAQTVQYNLIEKNIFGSARLGTKEEKTNMLTATVSPFKYTRILGWKKYEFSNHLGNVLTVFCDVKVPLDNNTDGTVDAYRVCLQNTFDYSPFGAALDGRTMQGDGYRYGFNGKEDDKEVKGQQDYGFRIFDKRLGRFLSVDPLFKDYPNYSTYQFAGNTSISAIDLDGLEPKVVVTDKITGYTKTRVYGAGNITEIMVATYLAKVQYTDKKGITTTLGEFNVTRDGFYDIGTDKIGNTILINRSSDPIDNQKIYIKHKNKEQYGKETPSFTLTSINSPIDEKYNKTFITKGIPDDPLSSNVIRYNGIVNGAQFHVSGTYIGINNKKKLGGTYGCFGIVDPSQVMKTMIDPMPEYVQPSNYETKEFGNAIQKSQNMQIQEHSKEAKVEVIIKKREYVKTKLIKNN